METVNSGDVNYVATGTQTKLVWTKEDGFLLKISETCFLLVSKDPTKR